MYPDSLILAFIDRPTSIVFTSLSDEYDTMAYAKCGWNKITCFTKKQDDLDIINFRSYLVLTWAQLKNLYSQKPLVPCHLLKPTLKLIHVSGKRPYVNEINWFIESLSVLRKGSSLFIQMSFAISMTVPRHKTVTLTRHYVQRTCHTAPISAGRWGFFCRLTLLFLRALVNRSISHRFARQPSNVLRRWVSSLNSAQRLRGMTTYCVSGSYFTIIIKRILSARARKNTQQNNFDLLRLGLRPAATPPEAIGWLKTPVRFGVFSHRWS